MSIFPVSIARVSDLQRSDAADQAITRTQQQLDTTQNELSTGLRVSQPSDDPAAAAIIQQLQETLAHSSAYSTNLNQANSQLGEVDNQLSSLENLLQQAQSIASANVGSDVTASARTAAASVVNSIYTQAISVGNTQFEGSYLFGGDNATNKPFVETSTGVTFVGSATTLQNSIDDNTTLPFQVNGAQVFGALSSQVQGSVNLNPAVTAQTRLTDLGGATNNGVRPGAIQISNGSTSQVIDLSTANSVGDVVNAINNAGLTGVTASVSGSSLVINAAAGVNLNVTNVGGATTATDLGIATNGPTGAGVNVTGLNLNAKVTPITPLTDLLGGTGLDPAGIVITNGAQSATLSFGSDTTVQDLLNTINGSNTSVRAQINATGTGIDILNASQGSTLTIGESGGTTATQLGVRSFSPSTLLANLNGGQGVQTATGGAADFQVTRRDGSTFQVSIAGAQTVQDVINDINTADAGGGVTASFATTGNGIVLTDTTGGAGTLGVTALNNSQAAAELGLNATASGAVLTGSDANGVTAAGIIGDLGALRDALTSSNQQGITTAAQNLQNDYNRVTDIRGQNGALLQQVQGQQTNLSTQNTSTQSLLSQLQDADYTTTITQFQTLQTALQAGLETTARTLSISLLDFLV